MSAFSYHSEKYDFSSAKKATFLQNTDDLDKYCKSAKKKKKIYVLESRNTVSGESSSTSYMSWRHYEWYISNSCNTLEVLILYK